MAEYSQSFQGFLTTDIKASAPPADGPHCPICLEDWDSESKDVAQTPCNHIMHKECLLSWLGEEGEQNSCPVCRAIFFETDTQALAYIEERLDQLSAEAEEMIDPERLDENYGVQFMNDNNPFRFEEVAEALARAPRYLPDEPSAEHWTAKMEAMFLVVKLFAWKYLLERCTIKPGTLAFNIALRRRNQACETLRGDFPAAYAERILDIEDLCLSIEGFHKSLSRANRLEYRPDNSTVHAVVVPPPAPIVPGLGDTVLEKVELEDNGQTVSYRRTTRDGWPHLYEFTWEESSVGELEHVERRYLGHSYQVLLHLTDRIETMTWHWD